MLLGVVGKDRIEMMFGSCILCISLRSSLHRFRSKAVFVCNDVCIISPMRTDQRVAGETDFCLQKLKVC